MCDTIYFRLSATSASKLDFKRLNDCRDCIDVDTGETIVRSGKYKDWYVTLSDKYLRIKGSLSKYYFGNNIYSMQRREIEEAIDRLSKELNVNLRIAIITRLDIANTFKVSMKVKSYYPLLGPKKYYERFPYLNSLYYVNKNRQVNIYDKIQELKDKGVSIPLEYRAGNWMRFEARYNIEYLKTIMECFGKKEMRVEDLLEPKFYAFLIHKWQKEYDDILKINKTTLDLKKAIAVPAFKKFLMLKGIESMGGTNSVLGIIDRSRVIHSPKHPESLSRLKRAVKEISTSKDLTFESQAIRLLDKRINEFTNNQLLNN